MNLELVLSLIVSAGAVIMAFLYARTKTSQLEDAVEDMGVVVEAQRDVLADKEEYIRELEKTVVGSLPAGELARRLNRLFAANRSRSSGALPAVKPPTRTP
jgi:hypothetical protein